MLRFSPCRPVRVLPLSCALTACLFCAVAGWVLLVSAFADPGTPAGKSASLLSGLATAGLPQSLPVVGLRKVIKTVLPTSTADHLPLLAAVPRAPEPECGESCVPDGHAIIV